MGKKDKKSENTLVVKEEESLAIEAVDEVIEEVDETLEKTSKHLGILKILILPVRLVLLPFKLLWVILKFMFKSFIKFKAKFRTYLNYATDEERGPVIRFTSWIFLRLGLFFGVIGGAVLQYYFDIVGFIINIFD